MKKWRNVELKAAEAKRFREYLMDMHVQFESSDAGYGYTHFECFLSDFEAEEADVFLATP